MQGLTGFGYGIVAMAVLPLFVESFQLAFTLVALNSLVIPALVMWNTRQGIRLWPAIPLSIGGIIGTHFGFHYMNENSNAEFFIRLFGITLILFAVIDFILTRVLGKYTMPKWLGFPCGVIGGIFGGAFNIGGPPMVAYAYSQAWSKEQIVSTLQIAFICATGYRIGMMGFNGYFDWEIGRLAALALIPTAIGIWIGGKFLARIDKAILKGGVFILVALLGVLYLTKPPV